MSDDLRERVAEIQFALNQGDVHTAKMTPEHQTHQHEVET